MTDDTPETILTNVVAVLEEHTKILQHQRKAIDQLFQDTEKIKQRLDSLESADSLNSEDAQFLSHVTARLKAISQSLDKTD